MRDWPLVVRLGLVATWIAIGAAYLGSWRQLGRELEPCLRAADGTIGGCGTSAGPYLVAGVAAVVAGLLFLAGYMRSRGRR